MPDVPNPLPGNRKGGILGRPGTSFDPDTGITPLQSGLTCMGGVIFIRTVLPEYCSES